MQLPQVWRSWPSRRPAAPNAPWQLFDMVDPVRHGTTAAAIGTWQVEPYVAAPTSRGRAASAAVAGPGPRSAGWMYRLIIESLLGLHRDPRRADPRTAPAASRGLAIDRLSLPTATYAIAIRRDAHVSGTRIVVDGVAQGHARRAGRRWPDPPIEDRRRLTACRGNTRRPAGSGAAATSDRPGRVALAALLQNIHRRACAFVCRSGGSRDALAASSSSPRRSRRASSSCHLPSFFPFPHLSSLATYQLQTRPDFTHRAHLHIDEAERQRQFANRVLRGYRSALSTPSSATRPRRHRRAGLTVAAHRARSSG